MLDGGDLGPAPLLEELYAGWVMQRGGGVRSEECGKALSIGERWRTGAVGQLEEVFREHEEQKHSHVSTACAELESTELKKITIISPARKPMPKGLNGLRLLDRSYISLKKALFNMEDFQCATTVRNTAKNYKCTSEVNIFKKRCKFHHFLF